MKIAIIAVLLIFALLGVSSCNVEEAETTEVSIITTDFTEETRRNMDADYKLWHRNKEPIIKKIENELIEKGWSDFEVSTLSEARYMFLYQVVGSVDDRHGNPMTVSVGVVFSEGAPEGQYDYITYTSESGRWYGCSEILYANDQVLYEYMHDLSIPQVQ